MLLRPAQQIYAISLAMPKPPLPPRPTPHSPPAPCTLLHPPGSPPSVCLCAGGAACYLDDLVREGERDFISCLPEGLWYLWCCKAALLKRKKKKRTRTKKKRANPVFVCGRRRSAGARQGRSFTWCVLLKVLLLWVSGPPPQGPRHAHSAAGVDGFIFRDTAMMSEKDQRGQGTFSDTIP